MTMGLSGRIAVSLTTLCFAAPFAAHCASLPLPIAPATQGKVECYMPDVEHKTCHSLVSYLLKADGSIASTETMVLVRSPVIIISMPHAVTVKGDKVCGYIALDDVGLATFTIDGTPATPEVTAKLRDRLQANYRPLYNREICTRYVNDADGTKSEVSIDGVVQPSGVERVAWVSPSDGYKVQP